MSCRVINDIKHTRYFLILFGIKASVLIQRLMCGKRFSMILKGLHICKIDTLTRVDVGYSSILKIWEFKEALEFRFCLLYEPGRNLSVDETLLCAYGCIAFKVWVITKAARYGIKMNVATDAVDKYVLRTSMYTGDDQGIISKDDTLKKQQMLFLI